MGVMAILIFSVLAKEAGLPYLPSGGAQGIRNYDVSVDRDSAGRFGA
jgi:peptide/nickel transport system permease protein